MEICFAAFTALIGIGFGIAASARLLTAKRAIAFFLFTAWAALWLGSLTLLPWAYAQPAIYPNTEVEHMIAVIEQVNSFLPNDVLNNILKIAVQIAGNIPLTLLSPLQLALLLLDSSTLLNIWLIAVMGALIFIGGLIALDIKLASAILIALNSLLVLILVSITPSIDQLGAINHSVGNFIMALLGITYGSGIVFALLLLIAFNAVHAFWLSSSADKTPTAKSYTPPSRFSTVSSSRFASSLSKPASNALRHSSGNSLSAIAALVIGLILLVSLLLPLISYSPAACQANLASLNSVLAELQRLTTDLPPEVKNALAFLPSAVNDPQDLFTSSQYKALVHTVCSEQTWTHSLWLMQYSGGSWTLTAFLILALSVLLIFIGFTRSTAAPLAIFVSVLSVVAILALTHALATIETFGYHNDFSFRIIALLGNAQPAIGAWLPLLVSAIALPIFLPLYLRECRVFS